MCSQMKVNCERKKSALKATDQGEISETHGFFLSEDKM